MKIPIDIRIRSERILSDLSRRDGKDHHDVDDYSVEGIMSKTKNGYRIEFAEQDDVTTTIVTNNELVSLNRIGPINSHMIFADGKTHFCICDTGLFPLQMTVRTKSLKNDLTLDGGRLDIDYTVEIVGNLAERNRLLIAVSPDRSIIRS